MKKKITSNKGFSLVELVIVVAIMGILISILAPMYFSYVEDTNEVADLQTAAEIIDAVKLAVISPQSNIPGGHYVEVLWITGGESGSSANKGSLIIRENDDARISVYNDKKGTDDLPTVEGVETLRSFADRVYMSLVGEKASTINNADWLQVEFEAGKSKMATEGNLAFHVNTSTGEVALARYGSGNINIWVALGLNAIPAP